MNARKSLFYSLCLYTALVQSTLAATTSTWTGNALDGMWTNNANWNPATHPNSVGAIGIFPDVINTTTIMVGAPQTVGTLDFTAPTNTYTISGSIFDLNNMPNPSAITATGTGSHNIVSPLVLATPLTVTPATVTPFTISGIISGGPGSPALTVAGSGTLVLSGANTYHGGTTLSDFSTLSVRADNNLGNGADLLTLSGGTLETTMTFSSGRPITITSIGIFNVDPGVTTTLTGNIGGGGHWLQ